MIEAGITHIFNRGCNREPIFLRQDNYRYLLLKAKACLSALPVSMIAYCLMPNHYHFLMRSDVDGALSRFVQRLFNSYVQAINRAYGRSGTLFEGRAKAVRVASEAHALRLCPYIHLNPVKAGLVAEPGAWPYSNYLEWVGERRGSLKDEAFMRMFFVTPSDYREHVEAYQAGRAGVEGIEDYLFDE